MSDPPQHPRAELAPLSDFPTVTAEEWQRRVEEELAGESLDTLSTTTRDGVVIRPLYTAEDVTADPAGFPGLPPYTRGRRLGGRAERAWRVAQEHALPSVDAAAEAIRVDAARGVMLFWLRLDGALRTGLAALAGQGGTPLAADTDLDRLLAAFDPARHALVLDAGANAAAVAPRLAAWAERRGVELTELRGSLAGDPLGALAADGVLHADLDTVWQELAETTRWAEGTAPRLRTLLVSTVPYHDAGATPVQELAFAAATGVESLRRLTAAGVDADTAARRTLFAWSVGSDLFVEVAKLRAARSLWSRIAGACGVGERGRSMRLHVRTSAASVTRFDPWLNLLRGCAQSFAAAVGGAWSIATTPFDAALGEPASKSRRHAIAAQHVLEEEAFLGRVADPGGGSWYLESLTDQLARAAWELFREIEADGGMTRALCGGRVAEMVERAAAERDRAVAERREPIVGVNVFARLGEELPERPPVAALTDALAAVPAGDGRATCPPLPRRRIAAPFEELRARAGGDGAAVLTSSLDDLGGTGGDG